jgi:hypothetical protein
VCNSFSSPANLRAMAPPTPGPERGTRGTEQQPLCLPPLPQPRVLSPSNSARRQDSVQAPAREQAQAPCTDSRSDISLSVDVQGHSRVPILAGGPPFLLVRNHP